MSKKENKIKNVAIIMDGNGRWAKKRLLPRSMGHREGMKTLKKVIEHLRSIGMDSVTVYAFSTENWKRPEKEIKFLLKLLKDYVEAEKDYLKDNDIKLKFIGKRDNLNEDILKVIEYGENYTVNCNSMVFNIAFNYGAREELLSTFKKVYQKIKKGDLDIDSLKEEDISDNLYTSHINDPDLLIRTSGELRVSNFLLWQIAYSEFYVTDTLWPDFSIEELDRALKDFESRKRRFGGI